MKYEHITLLVFGVVAAWVIFCIVRAIVRRVREKPEEFAAGVALSIVGDPFSWDYNSSEDWLISEKAAIEISLQSGNFGRVNTQQRANAGSTLMVQFQGADLRAFAKAYDSWRELTAINRQQIAERRKRDALAAMAA